ncbi:MAG: hypothetical protein ACREYE_22790 [Gammaproteobacteria bacterium]
MVRTGTHNRTIERLLTGEDIPVTGDALPEVMFARAHWLMQKNRGDEAIELFNRLEGKGDPEFRARLHYNLGNLYLARAIALTEPSEFARAFTLTILAKDLYRKALRLDSRDWDAKYNLEVAMRLVPDLPQAKTDEPDEQQRQQGLTPIPKFNEEGERIGFYSADDVPHASRFGLPIEDPADIRGYDPHNAPFGSEAAVGNEHLSSVRENYLKGLGAQTGLVYHHLESASALSAALQEDAFAERITIGANVRWIPALVALLLLTFLYGIVPKVERWR